ncbi:extracellular solute-binding protein [Zophobihabitans entericus]|uniref:extracellular solute-binding protein n=1 Tax=Zophobihabitans entericus TaxID=1635327 RepID=UPI001E2860D3|nr:extracellular solute-binding protein [Zophobihabitans entericus]
MFNFRGTNYFVFIILIFSSFLVSAQTKSLHIYNWSDYIAPDTISKFRQLTGTRVTYDVFDSNEVLDGKLIAGNTGFDIVVPTDSFLARQINSNIYLALDKSRLPNYHNLDVSLLELMKKHDPDNTYSIPYMWQSTGIGYNIDKVKEILGDDAPLNSWDLIFKPENLQKLQRCGVAFLDAPSEVFPTVLNYLGYDPNSQNEKDYLVATKLLEKLRPYVTYFHSSKYITDLSSGDICVAIAWTGDVMQAAMAAQEAKNGVNIGYIIPKEGAIISFDVLAVPKSARNVDAAYEFLNYLLEPKVIADISNHIYYANANSCSYPYLNEDVYNNPSIYPPDSVMKNLFPMLEQPPNIDRLMVRLWTRILTNK